MTGQQGRALVSCDLAVTCGGRVLVECWSAGGGAASEDLLRQVRRP